METFKLVIAALLSPLLISLILQTIAWAFWLRRRSPKAMALLGLGTIVLAAGGISGLTYEKRRAREFLFPPLDVAQELTPDKPVLAVVLGTGFNPDPRLPANSKVSGVFLARLLEGVRILRSHPDARLLVSVAGKADASEKRLFLGEMIDLLDLDPARVSIITSAQSTSDEAEEFAIQHKQEQVVVVTSAGHMVRAMQIFSDAGLEPHAAPADYGFARAGSPGEKVWPRWIPSADGISSNHQWLYETAAMLWHSISGG